MSPNDLLTKLSQTTKESGVYQMLDSNKNIIYIGKARNLKKRLENYFSMRAKDTKTIKLINNISDFKVIVTVNELQALLLENELIKKYQPKYNILLKDAKSYPYIVITKEKHPRIAFYRGKKKSQHHCFGPYPSSHSVRDSIYLLRKTFKLRECTNSFYNNRSRPCLDYQIGLCLAPCCIDNTNYQENVDNAILFMRGKSDSVIDNIREKMTKASSLLDFELAAEYRDQMINLRQINNTEYLDLDLDVVTLVKENNVVLIQILFVRHGKQIDSDYFIPKNVLGVNNMDILSSFLSLYYIDKKIVKTILVPQAIRNRTLISEGLNAKIIKRVSKDKQKFMQIAELTAKENLKQYLRNSQRINKQLSSIKNIINLDTLPTTIECFDVSHHYGEATVASCINFYKGKPNKKAYKKFNIKTNNIDDYAALYEAIIRRYKDHTKLPDLLIIDGGLGQLNKAIKALDDLKLSLKVIGVTKDQTRKSGLETLIMKNNDQVQKIKLKPDNSALLLINYIRDESHRFAISSHRHKMLLNRNKFSLEAINGVGKTKSKALISYFGSLNQIKKASIQELTKVSGINNKIATKIKTFFINKP